MIIKKVEFVKSAVASSGYPEHSLSEFAFFGRSNVGKSSFINALVNRKNLAYTSQTPGKTQTLNFYIINDAISIVDVPGYGYAIRSDAKKETFGKMIEEYLKQRANLKVAFLLVDIRHDPSEDDRLMLNYLRSFPFQTAVIATKADKVGTTMLNTRLKGLSEVLQIAPEDILLTSSVSKKGIDDVWKTIENHD